MREIYSSFRQYRRFFGLCCLLGLLSLGGCFPQGPPEENPAPSSEASLSGDSLALQAVPCFESVTVPGKSTRPRKGLSNPLRPPTPTLVPIKGMGTGEVFPHRDIPDDCPTLNNLAQNLNGPEKEPPRVFDPCQIKGIDRIADQVEEARDSLENSALRGSSAALNALPLVHAEPDKAELGYSGGAVRLGISIPVERLRLGNPLPPEKTSKDLPEEDS